MNRWLRRIRTRNHLSNGLVILLVAALVFAAVNAERYQRPQLDLHDAGIWVSWVGEQAVGRTNTEIKQVDTRVDAAASDFDVLQSDEHVFIQQDSPPVLKSVDPRLALTETLFELPATAEVALGGDQIAVLDRQGGRYWSVAADAVGSIRFDDAERPPTGVVDGDSRLTMGLDGTAHVLDLTRGEFQSVRADGTLTTTPLDGEDLENVRVTAVGSTPVAMNRATDELLVPGESPIDIEALGAHPVLQQAGPDNADVYVATDDGLWRVPLSGEEPQEVFADGSARPAEPVYLNGCAYGAWGATATWARACEGQDTTSGVFPGVATNIDLRWRVNRDRVLLNEMINGVLLVFIDGDPQLIDNWDQALSDQPEQNEDPDDEVREIDQQIDDEVNDPPEAEDDEAATRPERPLVVPVLANDSDPDGDVLSVIEVGDVDESVGSVSIIDGGQAIQVTPAPGQTSPIIFEYRIDDGHDHEAAATVSVAIHGPERNDPPEPVEDETIVEAGQVVTHNVLVNDTDPNGDALTLAAAESGSEPEAVLELDDAGQINFHAPVGFVGDATVNYTTVDEGGLEAEGLLTVHVLQPELNEPPVARNDHGASFVDREVIVDLLANDSDANADPLRLVEVDNQSGAEVFWDSDSSEVRVVGASPGPVIVRYTVTDGFAVDEAFLRVDVRAPGEQNPPVAVRDDVVLQPGAPAIVGVLDNDVDLDGDILVVQSVSVPAAAPISVELVERSVARVTSTSPLTEPWSFTYQITDGSGEASGTVVVRPGLEQGQNQPPVAIDDESTVRAGNIAAVDVLANDTDPERDTLTLVEATVPPADGSVFIQDGILRYEAPDSRRSAVVGRYVLEDRAGNRVSGAVTFRVTDPDPEDNTAPVAPTVTARTIAGQSVEVRIPVTISDPDGDPVTLEGLAEPPGLGSVVEVLPDRIVYLPDQISAGTDTFRYSIRDQYGAEATGTVLVGVAQPATRNSRPIAVPDEVVVRPGSRVQIDVLRNDSDPDGEAIFVGERGDDMLTQPTAGAVRLQDGLVVFDANGVEDGERTAFGYVVSDRRGGQARGTVQVEVSSTVPNQPPIAVDDILRPETVGSIVEVDVLDNDTELDNEVLEITDVTGEGVRIVNRRLRFTMPEESVTFSYGISDGTRTNTARAVVQVPLADNGAPRVGFDTATTDEGEPVIVDVLENDEDPEQEDLTLLEVVGVRHGQASLDGDRVRFSPDPGYVGSAGFSYVVADAENEAEQLTSMGTARIDVQGTTNSPPAWTELVLAVPQDGETTVDLRGGVFDADAADNDRHTFRDLQGETNGVSGDIVDGHRLVVRAQPDAQVGATVPLSFTVTDGRPGGEIEGGVLVEITSSDEELAQAVNDQGYQAFAGETISIPVLRNDLNPFPTPLEIVSVEQPGAGGSVSIAGDELEFTASGDYFGTTSFAYTVRDETGQPDREVDATVQVTVIGRPDLPPAPTGERGVGQVRLRWGVPASNGAPITEYVVRASTGDERRTPTNALTFDGLENGREVTFRVAAINDAGQSDFGPSSAPFTPDAIPDVPDAPRPVAFGDGSITVEWDIPRVQGSPVSQMVLPINPGGTQQEFSASQTQVVWDGLTNGTRYTFRLKAINDAGPSDFGPWSQVEWPAAPPGPPSTPVVVPGDTNLTVSWDPPSNDGGDAVNRYQLRVFRNGSLSQTIDYNGAGVPSQLIQTENGVPYAFDVRAGNKSPEWGVYSGRSAPEVSAGPPLAVSGVTATEGDTTSTLSFGPPNDNGAEITGYEYAANGGGWSSLPSDRIIRGLTNGTNYTFQVRALNAKGAGQSGPASNRVRPYGAPTTPSINASSSGKTITWNWSASTGNGRTVTGYEVSLNGGGWTSVGGSRSYSREVGDWGDGASLRVRAVSDGAERNRSNEASASGSTQNPSASMYRGSSVNASDCRHSSCARFGLVLERYRANTNYSYTCYGSRDGGNFWTASITTNGSGSFSGDLECYYGFPGAQVQVVGISARTSHEPTSTNSFTW